MNLQVALDERLANAVSPGYDSKNYSGAVIDAIHLLGDLIRSKSGLDFDGQQLIGGAFGGPNPLIKVNSLQTESERDEQKGIEHLLRGLYSGIRNPRSHAKRDDNAETANALIAFIDFLIRTIDKGRSPYDVPSLISRVFDPDFSSTEKYAQLLVNEIPSIKRLDVLMQVFQRRLEGEGENVALFCNAVLSRLTIDQQTEFWAAASEALRSATSDAEYRSIIQIAGGRNWDKLAEIARIRAEHRLIKSIGDGELNLDTRKCRDGSLGTWACGIAKQFTLQDELVAAIGDKLQADTPEERGYVFKHFFKTLRGLRPKPPYSIVAALTARLQEHDQQVYEALRFLQDPDPWAEDEWTEALKDAYCSFQPPPRQWNPTDNDVPF